MAETREDQPDIGLHPPSIFISALIVGFVIRVFAGGWLPIPHIAGEGIGGVMMVAALVISVSAISAFAENGETLRPATPSQALLTGGMYRFSRNPIYLAMALFGTGFGFATLNLWIIVTTSCALLIMNFFVIPQEEAYLDRKFGADYREFKEKVRRWV